MTNLYVLAFLIFFVLCSCSSHQENTSSTLSVAVGNLHVPNMASYKRGGAILYGLNHENGDSFATNLASVEENLEFELSNGKWSFAGFLWNGNSAFTGDVFCSFIEISLEGGEIDLPLVFNNSNCANKKFAENSLKVEEMMTFPRLHLISCGSDQVNCKSSLKVRKVPLSYKIKLVTFNNNVRIEPGRGLTSGCHSVNAQKDMLSHLALPTGDGELPFRLEIQAFYDMSCSQEKDARYTVFDKGLKSEALMKKVQLSKNGQSALFYMTVL